MTPSSGRRPRTRLDEARVRAHHRPMSKEPKESRHKDAHERRRSLEETILDLCAAAGAQKSIDPIEAAKAFSAIARRRRRWLAQLAASCALGRHRSRSARKARHLPQGQARRPGRFSRRLPAWPAAQRLIRARGAGVLFACPPIGGEADVLTQRAVDVIEAPQDICGVEFFPPPARSSRNQPDRA